MLWLFHFKRNPFHSPPNIFVRHLKHKIQPPNTFSEVVLANDSGDLHKVRKGMYMCVCRHVKKIYIYDGGLRPPSPPPPPRMGWVQNLRFSYIFMEPAKTHGIYTVLTSSASETVVFAAFCNTTLYTTTLIVLLLQKQQQLLLLLPLLRTTTYYYVLLRTTTYYYVLLRTTTYYYVLLRTTTYYYVLLRTSYTYYYVLRIRTTTYYVYVRLTTTYYYVGRNIMCICNIFVCIHNKNDMPTLLGHVHTYIQTNHKSIQTNSYHT